MVFVYEAVFYDTAFFVFMLINIKTLYTSLKIIKNKVFLFVYCSAIGGNRTELHHIAILK